MPQEDNYFFEAYHSLSKAWAEQLNKYTDTISSTTQVSSQLIQIAKNLLIAGFLYNLLYKNIKFNPR